MNIKEQAIRIFEEHFEQWESVFKGIESGYQFESTYSVMVEKVLKEALQQRQEFKKNSRHLIS